MIGGIGNSGGWTAGSIANGSGGWTAGSTANGGGRSGPSASCLITLPRGGNGFSKLISSTAYLMVSLIKHQSHNNNKNNGMEQIMPRG